MDVKSTMRIGCNPFYPIPPDIHEDHQAEWFINRMAELGCTSAQTRGIKNDPDLLKRVRELCEEKNVELDCSARGVFGLVGPDAKESREQLLGSVSVAQQAGTNIIRTGYGRLNVATSRFNKEIPWADHRSKIVNNLVEAAKIVEDNDMLLAIENHCDFTGKQWAGIFEEVGSKSVGVALDTANGYTVFSDPDEEVQHLAPYTITTHLKDMGVHNARDLDFISVQGPLIPMLPIGCAVGDGNVDIPLAIDTFAAKSPCAEGLHLIIELGWWPVTPGMTNNETVVDMFHRSIEYLKTLLAT